MVKFSLHGSRRRFEVAGNDRDGYRVRVFVRPVMDDHWAELWHFALFAVERDAEDLMQIMDANPVLNLECWSWHPSPTLPWSKLQFGTPCELSMIPRPARPKRALA